jgi:hypothetical protein
MGTFVLRVAEHENQFKVNWTIIDGGEPPVTPPSYVVDSGALQQTASNIRRQLQVIAVARKPFEKPAFAKLLKQLAQLGGTLFKHLMGPASAQPEVRQRFCELADGSNQIRQEFRIILDTDRLFVPWGFVFSGEVSDVPTAEELNMSLADMKGFWLSHFNISVTYLGTPALPRQRKTTSRKLFALHEVMFTEARALLKTEDEECLERLDKLLDDKMTPVSDWESFRDVWTEVGSEHDSVLYLYGHSDGQRIELREPEENEEGFDTKFELSAADLIGYRKAQPGESAAIFLLNGCRTAAPGSKSGDVPVLANFLKATREPGYFGFIGTETEVTNVFACRYGTEFLWRLYQEGKTVGETFDELLQSGKLFPQNLLYACYADRRFHLASTSNSDKPS